MMNMDMGFGLFPMIAILLGLAVLPLLIVGVVVLFVKLRAKAWWIVGPIMLVPVLLAGLWYSMMRMQTPMQNEMNMNRSFMVFPIKILLGLTFLALLIAGVVVLFVKLRAKAWWIVGPLLLVPVLMAGLAVPHAVLDRSYKASYSRTSSGAGRSSSVRVMRSRREAKVTIPADSALGDRFSETFLAVVYPSPRQAAEALALDVARSFHNSLYGMEPDDPRRPAKAMPEMPRIPTSELPDILVTGQADLATLQVVAEAFRQKALARSVSVATAPATSGPASVPAASGKKVLCAVRVDGEDSGTVQIVLQATGRQIIRSTRFVSKPWAANFAQYAASAGKPVVRAGSAPVASFEQAQDEAFERAAQQLVPYFESLMKTNPGDNRQFLRQGILAELRKGKLILDRFPQRFDRSYGNLWREQMLIDASEQAIKPLAGAISAQMIEDRSEARQTWWNLFATLGGMAVLIFAVYLVLNAATKGYYTWVLRVLALLAVVAALVVIA